MEIGDWIEFGNLIIEVTSITETDVIGKIVLYDSADPKLRYGEPVAINKLFLEGEEK